MKNYKMLAVKFIDTYLPSEKEKEKLLLHLNENGNDEEFYILLMDSLSDSVDGLFEPWDEIIKKIDDNLREKESDLIRMRDKKIRIREEALPPAFRCDSEEEWKDIDDEPISDLDWEMEKKIRDEIDQIWNLYEQKIIKLRINHFESKKSLFKSLFKVGLAGILARPAELSLILPWNFSRLKFRAICVKWMCILFLVPIVIIRGLFTNIGLNVLIFLEKKC